MSGSIADLILFIRLGSRVKFVTDLLVEIMTTFGVKTG